MRWVETTTGHWMLSNKLGIKVELTVYSSRYIANINDDKWEIPNNIGNRGLDVAKEMVRQSLEVRLINAMRDLDELMD